MIPCINMPTDWLEKISHTGHCSAGEARAMAWELVRRRKEEDTKTRYTESGFIPVGYGVPHP